MFELSPFVTAASAPAVSVPAASRASRSNPEPDHLGPGEVRWEPVEGALGAVDDRDGVALVLELGGDAGADPPASDDDDVHREMSPRSDRVCKPVRVRAS